MYNYVTLTYLLFEVEGANFEKRREEREWNFKLLFKQADLEIFKFNFH